MTAATLRALLVAVVIALCAAGAVAPAATPAEVPVMIGDEPDLDACMSQGEVRGLDPEGDGFLAVRAGPGTGYALRDRLREGRRFNMCDSSADGAWVGVVYAPADDDAIDCGVNSPVPRRVAYRGPCAYGWVSARWVALIAG